MPQLLIVSIKKRWWWSILPTSSYFPLLKFRSTHFLHHFDIRGPHFLFSYNTNQKLANIFETLPTGVGNMDPKEVGNMVSSKKLCVRVGFHRGKAREKSQRRSKSTGGKGQWKKTGPCQIKANAAFFPYYIQHGSVDNVPRQPWTKWVLHSRSENMLFHVRLLHSVCSSRIIPRSFSFSSLKMKKNDAWDMLSTIPSYSPPLDWLPPRKCTHAWSLKQNCVWMHKKVVKSFWARSSVHIGSW